LGSIKSLFCETWKTPIRLVDLDLAAFFDRYDECHVLFLDANKLDLLADRKRD
jgi:hypothetical protein